MTTLQDSELTSHAERVRGRVLLITGAASGIGRATAIKFASYGAKVVIGDVDISGAHATVDAIKASGGVATCMKCDVLSWDDQSALFRHAIDTYGAVDVVIPNAGISEVRQWEVPKVSEGLVAKPNMKTLDINLNGALYTTHLALHYLEVNRDKEQEGALKSIIFIASIASWQGIGGAPMYSASKHALLGVMRALHPLLEPKGIRICSIHPWFADTNIISPLLRIALAGVPLTPVDRIAGAIFLAATDDDPKTAGCPYLLPDDGPLLVLPQEQLREGVYDMLNTRVRRVAGFLQGAQQIGATTAALVGIFAKPIVVTAVLAGAGRYAWKTYNRR